MRALRTKDSKSEELSRGLEGGRVATGEEDGEGGFFQAEVTIYKDLQISGLLHFSAQLTP